MIPNPSVIIVIYPGYDIYGLDLEAYYESKYFFSSMAYSYIKGKREASPRRSQFLPAKLG